MKNIESKEQIIRKVTSIGNGAHIFAPKDWLNEEVLIVRIPKPTIKEEILDVLKPHLENIVGAYIYGSYARGEETKNSDKDLLLIINKRISIKKEGYEIICLQEEDMKKAIEISPILIYSALNEAKPIINSYLLEKLKKKYRPEVKYLKRYLEETKEIVRINKEAPSLYSLILRLKGVYLIRQLLSGKNYSNKNFKSWIMRRKSKINLEKIDNYKKDSLLNNEEANFLLNILKNEIKEIETKNGKAKKRLEKGMVSLEKQKKIHLKKKGVAKELGQEELVGYYEKEIESLEKRMANRKEKLKRRNKITKKKR